MKVSNGGGVGRAVVTTCSKLNITTTAVANGQTANGSGAVSVKTKWRRIKEVRHKTHRICVHCTVVWCASVAGFRVKFEGRISALDNVGITTELHSQRRYHQLVVEVVAIELTSLIVFP